MINLLPPQEKETLLWEERQRMGVLLGIVLFVFLLSFSLTLFAGEFYIKGEAQAANLALEAEKINFEASGFGEVQAKAEQYQKILVSLAGFTKQETNITMLAEVLSRALPPSTYLTFLSWGKDGGRAQISGFAPARADLFAFKENLESEPFFESADFPPGNWIKSGDINFQATLRIASP